MYSCSEHFHTNGNVKSWKGPSSFNTHFVPRLSVFSSSSITLSEMTDAVFRRDGVQHIRKNLLNDFLNLLKNRNQLGQLLHSCT